MKEILSDKASPQSGVSHGLCVTPDSSHRGSVLESYEATANQIAAARLSLEVEVSCLSALSGNKHQLTDHFVVGLVSTLSTVAIGSSTQSSYSAVTTSKSKRWFLRHLNSTTSVLLGSTSFSRSIATLMYQNGSDTKLWTLLYWSTTNPSVGNWHGPTLQRHTRWNHVS